VKSIALNTRRAPRRANAHSLRAVPASFRRLHVAVCVALTFGAALPAHAFGLADAYDAAFTHDPVYAAAIKERDAGEENRAIGRSYLLPNLSANYANYRDWTRTTQLGPLFPGEPQTTDQQYRAYAGGVSLRQPLFSYEGIARYRYGKAQALASEATFTGHSEELLVRVLSAYTDTAYALDQLALALAQQKAFDEQLASNEALFRNGEGTRTDILETRAKAELARADVADARDNVDNMAHALEALTGLSVDKNADNLDRLTDKYKPDASPAGDFDQWHDIALENNADLIAERHTVEAARQQVEIVRAGFYPRVDIVASMGRNQSDSVNTIGTRYTTKSIGVELTIPLYSGGLVSASSRQAKANFEREQFILQDKTDKVLLDVRKQYNVCMSSLTRIDALERAVESATLLITATRKSVQAGMRTNLDVLTAEQQLYQSKRDLAKARYQYLLATLQLRKAAGVLTAENLYDVSKWFIPASIVNVGAASADSQTSDPSGVSSKRLHFNLQPTPALANAPGPGQMR
jgi:protease secretion system outer membrane protein